MRHLYFPFNYHLPPLFTTVATANTSILYKRAIVHAIGELQDYHLRSNIDSIRRHVQSTLESDQARNHHLTPPWNETIFLKTLKTLIQDGDVEQCTSLNCGLSPVFKRRITNKAQKLSDSKSAPSLTGLTYPFLSLPPHEHEIKDLPVKKIEHYKLKIIPKKIYDLQQ